MLVDVSDFSSTFQDIVQKNFQEKAAILILVAPDVDALCACRILTTLLRSHNVMYKIKQISGYVDMSRVNQTCIENNDELLTVIMINCGATNDLKSIITFTPELKCYVIDAHRPVVINNVTDASNVCSTVFMPFRSW